MELDPSVYTVAWIAPLEIETKAALYMLDNRHEGKFSWSYGYDSLFYAGDINGHNVIIATLPSGQNYGTASAAALASQIKSFFINIKFGLLVGVAAGLPNLSSQNASLRRDIRLGDVLVGLPEGESAGLIAYDLGKETKDGFHLLHGGHALAKTETIVRSAIGSIKIEAPYDAAKFLPFYETIKDKEHAYGTFADPGQDQDKLYGVDENGEDHVVIREPRPSARRVRAWYGPIGSGEKLMKNAQKRDELRDRYNVIGLEMGAAGTMDVIPVGVIRGVCNYGDEHKNDEWQPYAAAMAAAYAKAILYEILPRKCKPNEPEPSSTIPFERDRMFIGREDIIAAIENAFKDNDELSGVHTRAAITGLGGVGKSQIAIEYTYRVRDLIPTTWGFWKYAATATRFDEGYRKLLGPEHQAILSSTGNLFILLMLRKKYKQAVVLYPEALPFLIEWFKATDPFFLKFAREVVVMLIDEEKYDEAQDLLGRIVDKDKELLGAQNPYTLRDIDWLDRLASGAGHLKAGSLYRQALTVDGYLLRNEDPDKVSNAKDLVEARRSHKNLLFSSRNLVILSLVAILLLYYNPSAWA